MHASDSLKRGMQHSHGGAVLVTFWADRSCTVTKLGRPLPVTSFELPDPTPNQIAEAENEGGKLQKI